MTMSARCSPIRKAWLLILLLAVPAGVVAETRYVAPTGNDSGGCMTPAAPCATINAAIAKSVSGDSIRVAVGTYTGTGAEAVFIDKSVTVSGVGIRSSLGERITRR